MTHTDNKFLCGSSCFIINKGFDVVWVFLGDYVYLKLISNTVVRPPGKFNYWGCEQVVEKGAFKYRFMLFE